VFTKLGIGGGLVVALSATVLLGPPALASAAPANDDFADARIAPLGAKLTGTTTGATKQRGEPRHANTPASRSVWYRFSTTRKTTVVFQTCELRLDTVIAVYSGRSLRSLRAVDYSNNRGCASVGGSRVAVTARPGRTYWIAVVAVPPTGRFTLAVRRLNAPPNDDFRDAAPVSPRSAVRGTLRNSTRELHEPSGSDFTESRTVWFRLSVRSRTRLTVHVCNEGGETGVTVYTGRRLSRLFRIGPRLECAVTFTATADVVYRIQVGTDTRRGAHPFVLRTLVPGRGSRRPGPS
jgi:hypothetical protein